MILQCFRHIQSKNKDAKSAVSCFFNHGVQQVQIVPGGGYCVERVNNNFLLFCCVH